MPTDGDDTLTRERAAERYREFFDTAAVGLALLSPEGELLESNPTLQRMLGRSGDELRALGVRGTTLPEDLELDESLFRELVAGQRDSYQLDKRYLHRDGRVVWGRLSVSTSRDERGNLRHVSAVVVDITASKELEARLAGSERRYFDLFDNALVAIFRTRASNGEVLEANRRAAELVGIPESARLQGHVTGTFYTRPGERKRLLERLEAAGGRPVEFEVPLRSVAGPLVWIHGVERLSPGDGVIDVVAFDVTERRRLEEERAASERRLRRILETTPAAILLFDEEGKIALVNRAAEEVLGRPREQIAGWAHDDPRLGLAHLDGSPLGKAETPVAATRRARRPLHNLELSVVRAGGQRRSLSLNSAPLPAPSGGVVVSFHDTTERKANEEALRRATAGAEAADRAKTEFLSIASHELRTPLTPLRLLIQQCRRRLARGVPVPDEALAKMDRQVARLAQLVAGVLDVSRLTRGGLSLERRRLDLGELVSEIVGDFRAQARERPLSLTLPARPAMVLADPTRLAQVLAKLVDNALRYSPPETPVEVELEVRGEEARVSVSDRGPGIPEPLRRRLFTGVLVADTKPTRQAGLGLGLFLARNLVELHGGRIGYRGRPGGGSIFHFSLPLTRAEQAACTESSAAPHE